MNLHSLLDSVEAHLFHHSNTQQLASVLAAPAAETKKTMSISLPQLSLIPNAASLLDQISAFTGLSSAVSALEKVKAFAQAGDFEPATVDALLADIEAFLSSVGPFTGGKLAVLSAEVANYKSLVDKIEAGQTVVVERIDYTTKAGVKRQLSVSLSDEASPAAA